MSVLQVLYSDDLFKNRYRVTENNKMLFFLDYIPRYIITCNSCSHTRYEVRFLGEMHLDSVFMRDESIEGTSFFPSSRGDYFLSARSFFFF